MHGFRLSRVKRGLVRIENYLLRINQRLTYISDGLALGTSLDSPSWNRLGSRNTISDLGGSLTSSENRKVTIGHFAMSRGSNLREAHVSNIFGNLIQKHLLGYVLIVLVEVCVR